MLIEIDHLLTRQVEENRTPSVQYLFFDKDSIIHEFHLGLADIKNQIKASGNTTYNAYSVTKTFTALAILQLAEQKKLDIDLPANNRLSGFPYSSGITIRQLLTHSAGIPNPIPLGWIHLVHEHPSFDEDRFFSGVFVKNNKLRSKPNESYAYSNLGYVLLGQLIEKVSGVPYEYYIRENILKPLNILPSELGFRITGDNLHAKGYHKKLSLSNAILGLFLNKAKYMDKTEGKWKCFNDFYVNGPSYGGLIGTASALAKYIQELLKPNCILINEEHKRMLFAENHTSRGKTTGMCLSWFKGQINGVTYYAHAGGGGGFYCEIRIYPAPGLGSVIMFNRTGMTDERFLDKPDKYLVPNRN